MPDETALDHAHAAMSAAPSDVAARMAFHACLADSELFLMLEEEAKGETLRPQVFPLESGPVVLAFDTEARLAGFAGAAVPYAALPGRVLARMLAGQALGLGLNLDVAPSSILLPAEAMDWLAGMLNETPREMTARPEEITPPGALPEALLPALDARLARAAGLAQAAWLCGVRYKGGGQGHLLAFVGTVPEAERALARAVGEALAFSGLEAAALDVAFLDAEDALLPRLARVGLRFDLPEPEAAPEPPGPRPAPGTDPERPPRLR
ncbi:SseB family protein [Alkalilacustris brevis]|uniref:SseB family protein n=1 Tax=Alkalilacustris brevis TaxID=2026338 RepID=UPI000E0DD4D4|nr:SseB family protein [Alkalilacustris brevis]